MGQDVILRRVVNPRGKIGQRYMNLLAGSRLGPYEILDPIGKGGMGEVYRARDPRLNRQVAIKLLPPEMATDQPARERLRHEAMAAAALDHPYICKVFEIGEHDGALFLVMEYIAGETLHHRMSAGRIPLSDALHVAGEIAEALQEAHARGILHRDLKPANIMLTPQGHVKIMDFGLAKRMADLPAPDDATVEMKPQLDSPGDNSRHSRLHVAGTGEGPAAGCSLGRIFFWRNSG